MRRTAGKRLGESRRRLAVWLAILPVLLIIGGCGGNASSPSKTPTAPANIPTTTAAPTQTIVAATSSGEAGAATPAGSPPSQTPLNNGSGQSPAASSGLIFATPQSDEPIEKDAPTNTGPIIGYTPIPSSFDSNGDGFLSVPEFIQALQARYPTYDWPSGHKLDLNAVVAQIQAQSQTVGMQFENGYERQSLGTAFICAWEYTLRDSIYVNDNALVAESAERLKTELESNSDLYSNVLKHEEDVISKAQLGDPGPLQQDIDGWGCDSLPWESGTPEASPNSSSNSSAVPAPAAYRRDNDLA